MKKSILIPKYYYWLAQKSLKDNKLDIKRINAFIKQLSNTNILTNSNWHPIAFNKNKNGALVDGFLSTFFPRNKYKQYLTFLEDNAIIDINHSYSINNGVAKQARLKPIPKEDQFNIDLLDLIEVDAHKKYYDYVKDTYEVDESDTVVVATRDLLMSNDITVDIESAYSFIANSVKNKQITVDRATFYLIMLNDIQNKKIYVVRGENNNRLYHSFAGLKRELRQFILYKGKPFKYQLDAVNSQPLILGKLLYALHPTNKDVLRYYELVNTGVIYEYFAKRVYPLLNPNKEGRNKIKQDFLSFFYTNDNASIQDRKQYFQIKSDKYKKIKNIFINEFSFVWDVILSIKQDNHNRLALLLAQIESLLFTNKMEKTISKGCLTIHDSVMFVDKGLSFNIKRRIQYNEVKPNQLENIINKLNIGINKQIKQTINIINNIKYELTSYNSI